MRGAAKQAGPNGRAAGGEDAADAVHRVPPHEQVTA